MSSEEKVTIQMTLLKELYARNEPFLQPNDKSTFLKDFYHRCGVSKLYHQLIADFFHNNLQRGSCPKWARIDEELRLMFFKVKDIYAAHLPPIRPRKSKSSVPVELNEFAVHLSRIQNASAEELGDCPPSAKRQRTRKSVVKTEEGMDAQETEGENDCGLFQQNGQDLHLQMLEYLNSYSLKEETESDRELGETVTPPTASNELSNSDAPVAAPAEEEEEFIQERTSPQPMASNSAAEEAIHQLQLNLQQHLASSALAPASKGDMDKLNRKVSDVLRTQKKIAMDQEILSREIKEIKNILDSFINSVTIALKVSTPPIEPARSEEVRPEPVQDCSPESLPFDHIVASSEDLLAPAPHENGEANESLLEEVLQNDKSLEVRQFIERLQNFAQ